MLSRRILIGGKHPRHQEMKLLAVEKKKDQCAQALCKGKEIIQVTIFK